MSHKQREGPYLDYHRNAMTPLLEEQICSYYRQAKKDHPDVRLNPVTVAKDLNIDVKLVYECLDKHVTRGSIRL